MTFQNQKDQPKIKVTKNGPYLVMGEVPIEEQIIFTDQQGIPVKWQLGKQYPTKVACTLCRCGKTKTKPYCDGTHLDAKFNGAEKAHSEKYLNKPTKIHGPKLNLLDIEKLCASARFCHRAGGIWKLIPKSANEEATKTAIEEAFDCPSGRLIIQDKQTGAIMESNLKPSIGLIEDPDMGVSGPIWVKGGILVESADGKTYRVRNRVTLCRCGKSTNKPFCDSSHYPEEHVAHGDAEK